KNCRRSCPWNTELQTIRFRDPERFRDIRMRQTGSPGRTFWPSSPVFPGWGFWSTIRPALPTSFEGSSFFAGVSNHLPEVVIAIALGELQWAAEQVGQS